MNKLSLFFLITLFITSNACYKKPNNDSPTNSNDTWERLNLDAENNIRNLFPTSDELYIITDREFARVNNQQELVEYRFLDVSTRVYGRPMLSENTFFRITKNQDNIQQLEFHMTRNPNPTKIVKLPISDFAEDDETLLIETAARYTGAYSDDGSMFLLPVMVIPDYTFSFLLFNISMTGSGDTNLSVTFQERIDARLLPADFSNNLVNTRYINGNFYVTSLDGSFRITPNGSISRIFPTWQLDFFELDNKLYVTGFNNWEFYVSEDNGETWDRIQDIQTELRMIEVVNGQVFSQEQLGWPFRLANEGLDKAQEIVYNESFPSIDFSAYQNIVYFGGKYYLSIFKEVYHTDEIELLEE